MKKLLNIFLPLILFWMLTASRCKKEALPPETQEGRNTFGCHIDGKLFVPRGSGWSSPIKTCFYQFIYPDENGYVFYAGGRRDGDDGSLTDVNIGFDSLQLVEGKTYNLTEVKRGNAYGAFRYSPGTLSLIQNYSTSSLNIK